ncbi:MAG: hypothetical protein NC453_03025 [Muribaculum sp.]|nr:hypothetical protein [Muribaculum sp.]
MKKIIALLMLWIMPISILAEFPNECEDDSDDTIQIDLDVIKERNDHYRHHMPSRLNNVACYYNKGYLKINFESTEGIAILNIYDITGFNEFSQSFSTSSSFVFYLGFPSSALRIEIVTSHNTYEGWLNPL